MSPPPDLNPIETVIGRVQRGARDSVSHHQNGEFQTLEKSMPRPTEAVLAARGAPTPY